MLSRTVRTAVIQEAHIVFASVAVCVAIAGIAALVQPRSYGAKRSVIVSPATFLDPATTEALPALSGTIATVATSPAVLRRTAIAYTQAATDPAAAAARREQATPAWLRRHIELRPAGTSSLLEISATAPRREDAGDLATAEMVSLQGFIGDARPGSARGGPAGIRLVPVSGSRTQGLVSPNPIRNGLAGVFVGLIAGCALVVLLTSWRRRKTPGQAAAELGIPWLGTFAPERAGDVARAFLEKVAASQRLPRHVALVTGVAPGAAIDQVAHATVWALNERATRALLLDGELGARAIRRRLLPPPGASAVDTLPGDSPGDWTAVPAALAPAPLAGRPHADPLSLPGQPLELVRREVASSDPWPEWEFVVLSGPGAVRVDALAPLMRALDCIVVLVGAAPEPTELSALRSLVREAEIGRAAVGVIGVTESESQVGDAA
jgi:capsular polysaccharide biosynthesis protein